MRVSSHRMSNPTPAATIGSNSVMTPHVSNRVSACVRRLAGLRADSGFTRDSRTTDSLVSAKTSGFVSCLAPPLTACALLGTGKPVFLRPALVAGTGGQYGFLFILFHELLALGPQCQELARFF